MRKLRLGHLFPELLNLYADKGNIASIVCRAKWRDIEVDVDPIRLGTPFAVDQYDLLLLGGGSDREQKIIGHALQPYKRQLCEAVEEGLPMLAICGGYQLIGDYYTTAAGEKIEGLSIVSMHTLAGSKRLIGNVVIESPLLNGETIVGFENHAGRTHHSYEPLGRVKRGFGNNGEDQLEGIRYRNVIGTYIHGPLLPKNPLLTDHILRSALAHRDLSTELTLLDDLLEQEAHDAMVRRLLA